MPAIRTFLVLLTVMNIDHADTSVYREARESWEDVRDCGVIVAYTQRNRNLEPRHPIALTPKGQRETDAFTPIGQRETDVKTRPNLTVLAHGNASISMTD